MLVITVSSRSQLSKRISSQETLKKCLPFVEDVFFKISKKHSLNSEKTLWFSFRSNSNDVAKKLASCGFYFTKNQFHQNWDLKSLKSETGEVFLPRTLNLHFLETATSVPNNHSLKMF